MVTTDNSAILMELKSIDDDVMELEEIFGDIGLDYEDEYDEQESSSELEALNQLLKGTEFDTSVAEAGGTMSILDMIDADPSEVDMQEGWGLGSIGGWAKRLLKGKAKRWIKKIVRLVKKHKRLAGCAPKVAVAVAAFKAGKFGAALKAAYSAYKCIKKHL